MPQLASAGARCANVHEIRSSESSLFGRTWHVAKFANDAISLAGPPAERHSRSRFSATPRAPLKQKVCRCCRSYPNGAHKHKAQTSPLGEAEKLDSVLGLPGIQQRDSLMNVCRGRSFLFLMPKASKAFRTCRINKPQWITALMSRIRNSSSSSTPLSSSSTSTTQLRMAF